MTPAEPNRMIAIVNARVWSGDPRRPWADAVLLRGDRIEAVGSSAEVKKRAGETTAVVDAKGMMVVPGDLGALATGAAQGAPAPAGQGGAMLCAGAPAELVLLDRVLARVSPETLAEARIVLAVVGGLVVYDRDGLLPR